MNAAMSMPTMSMPMMQNMMSNMMGMQPMMSMMPSMMGMQPTMPMPAMPMPTMSMPMMQNMMPGMMGMQSMMPMMGMMPMMMAKMKCTMTATGMTCEMMPMDEASKAMFMECCKRMTAMMTEGHPMMMSCGGMMVCSR